MFTELPETDKATYVVGRRLEQLCHHGHLPRRGVVFDESSGSSGTPTSRVRGPAERRATARLLRRSFAYDVTAGFGGEGLSENMRTHLLRSYRQVKGSYRASDLEINLAAESDFTIALRREPADSGALRTALLEHPDAPLPMVFQYNPLDNVIETNAAGELIVTVCRAANLSPRIGYNSHDVGHVVRMPALTRLLRHHVAAHPLADRPLDLPVLFHYGRSDASVDFYGAIVTPDELRDALYAEPALADRMREFRLISWEDDDAVGHLLYAVELQPGRDPAVLHVADLTVRLTVRLAARNGDVANACRVAPDDNQPELRVFPAGAGPFDDVSGLKFRYVSRIDAATAHRGGLTGGGRPVNRLVVQSPSTGSMP